MKRLIPIFNVLPTEEGTFCIVEFDETAEMYEIKKDEGEFPDETSATKRKKELNEEAQKGGREPIVMDLNI